MLRMENGLVERRSRRAQRLSQLLQRCTSLRRGREFFRSARILPFQIEEAGDSDSQGILGVALRSAGHGADQRIDEGSERFRVRPRRLNLGYALGDEFLLESGHERVALRARLERRGVGAKEL